VSKFTQFTVKHAFFHELRKSVVLIMNAPDGREYEMDLPEDSWEFNEKMVDHELEMRRTVEMFKNRIGMTVTLEHPG